MSTISMFYGILVSIFMETTDTTTARIFMCDTKA